MPRKAKAKTEGVAAPAVITETAKAKAAAKAKEAAAAPPPKGFDDKPEFQPVRSGETVTVACKIPNGFRMDFYREVERTVEIKGGHDRIKQFVKDGSVQSIFLNGPAAPFGQMPRGRVIGKAAFTRGIPKPLWDRWLSENSQLDAVVNRQIFAHTTESHLVGIAKEEVGNLSLQGPMVQGDDPRNPRRRDRTGKMTKNSAIAPGRDDEEEAA